MSIAEKFRYFAVPAAAVGFPLEIFGAGGTGLLLAGIIGGTAAYFSEEIRYGIIDKIPRRYGASRASKLHWFVTGHEQEDYLNELEEKTQPQDVTQVLAQDEPMEQLQPKARVSDMRERINFAADDELARPALLPTGPLYFSEVLRTFTPSLEKIYLATLPDSRPIFIKARHLCHTALTGSTRGGKSQIIRQLTSQLCYAGAKVYLLNPHYIRYDLEAVNPHGRSCPEDWTPFEAYLKNDPRELIPLATKYKVIEHYLKVAYELVGKRLEIAGNSEQRLGAPHFIVIDELPAIVDEVPGATQYLKRILREGAKVGVFVINASQDLQVSTVFQGIGGGVRACYRTAFDVGSDPATQRALGLPVLNGLGKGNASLRCDDITSAGRVPFVDNEALYHLLGPSTYVASKNNRRDEEDELVAYLVSRHDEEEKHTEALPVQRRHVPVSSYEQHRQRIASRKTPVYARSTQVVVQETPRVEDETVEISAQDAFAVWSAGNASVRDLAKAMGITVYKATQLYGAMVKAGLIEKKTKVTVRED